MKTPLDPGARRHRQQREAATLAMMGSQVGLGTFFRSFLPFARAQVRDPEDVAKVEETCAKLRAFYRIMPRPWRAWHGALPSRTSRKCAMVIKNRKANSS